MKTVAQFFGLNSGALPVEKIDKYIYRTRLDKKKRDALSISDGPNIGIEVEVEGIRNVNALFEVSNLASYIPRYWKTDEDGSLRNHGVEFISNILSGIGIVNALCSLEAGLVNTRYNTPTFSERCSIHFHIDMMEYTIEDVIKLLITHIFVEPLVYNIPKLNNLPTREDNNFCVPFAHTDKIRKARRLYHSLLEKKNSISEIVEGKEYKYYGFNVNSLAYHGTIEFRHFPGTINSSIICSWINYIYAMIRYARKHSLEDLKATLYSLNTNSKYMQEVTQIFGNPFPFNLTEKLVQKLENNVKFIKLITTKPSKETKEIEIEEEDYVIKYLKDKAMIFSQKEENSQLTEKQIELTSLFQNWYLTHTGVYSENEKIKAYNKYISEANIYYIMYKYIYNNEVYKDYMPHHEIRVKTCARCPEDASYFEHMQNETYNISV